jgi:hypothetical protein
MEIASIRQRLFNTTKYEKTVTRQSNPFASFKGNVLNADVFETLSNEASAQNNKLTYSALVGSMANFGSKIKEKWNAMISFGSALKEQVAADWDNLLTNQLPTFKAIGDFLNKPIGVTGNKYETMPIAQLSHEFRNVVNELEAGNF